MATVFTLQPYVNHSSWPLQLSEPVLLRLLEDILVGRPASVQPIQQNVPQDPTSIFMGLANPFPSSAQITENRSQQTRGIRGRSADGARPSSKGSMEVSDRAPDAKQGSAASLSRAQQEFDKLGLRLPGEFDFPGFDAPPVEPPRAARSAQSEQQQQQQQQEQQGGPQDQLQQQHKEQEEQQEQRLQQQRHREQSRLVSQASVLEASDVIEPTHVRRRQQQQQQQQQQQGQSTGTGAFQSTPFPSGADVVEGGLPQASSDALDVGPDTVTPSQSLPSSDSPSSFSSSSSSLSSTPASPTGQHSRDGASVARDTPDTEQSRGTKGQEEGDVHASMLEEYEAFKQVGSGELTSTHSGPGTYQGSEFLCYSECSVMFG